MDAGYQPSYTYPPDNNYANAPNDFPHYFVDQTNPSTSIQPTGDDSSGPLCFSFDPHHSAMNNFSSTSLVDYSIFDTPVDISLGALPPRPTSSRALAQGRIPRPRNAFMLFRSAFHREKRLAKSIEKDHRHISRIIGLCWAGLSEAEKDGWRQKAEIEKQQHALAYPEYRFKPTPRTKQPIKRNVKRNTPKEIERCHKIAKLLRDGKSGEELTHAVRRMGDDQQGGTPCSGHEGRYRKRKTFGHVDPPVSQHLPDLHHPAGHCVASDELPLSGSPLLPPSEFFQIQSKRPESAAALESAHMSPAQQTTFGDPLEPTYDLYSPQAYATQAYLHPGLNPTTGLHQRLQADGVAAFEWPAKDLTAVPFNPASLKQQYPESPRHSSSASLGVRGSLDSSYTPGGQFIPSIVPGVGEWGVYYRQELTAPVFTESAVQARTGAYDSLSTSSKNTSASPTQSDSPITAL